MKRTIFLFVMTVLFGYFTCNVSMASTKAACGGDSSAKFGCCHHPAWSKSLANLWVQGPAGNPSISLGNYCASYAGSGTVASDKCTGKAKVFGSDKIFDPRTRNVSYTGRLQSIGDYCKKLTGSDKVTILK